MGPILLRIYFPLLPLCSVVLIAEVIDDVNYNGVHHPSTFVVGSRFVGVPGVDHLLLVVFPGENKAGHFHHATTAAVNLPKAVRVEALAAAARAVGGDGPAGAVDMGNGNCVAERQPKEMPFG